MSRGKIYGFLAIAAISICIVVVCVKQSDLPAPSNQNLTSSEDVAVIPEEPRLIVPAAINLPGVGSTYQLEPKVVGADVLAFKYGTETVSKAIVDSSGKIELTGMGITSVYVEAQIGPKEWLFKEIIIGSPAKEIQVFYDSEEDLK